MFKKNLNEGHAGENVGVLLRGVKREELLRGQVRPLCCAVLCALCCVRCAVCAVLCALCCVRCAVLRQRLCCGCCAVVEGVLAREGCNMSTNPWTRAQAQGDRAKQLRPNRPRARLFLLQRMLEVLPEGWEEAASVRVATGALCARPGCSSLR